MATEVTQEDYEDRIGRVITYVFDHLDDELDLNRLASIACLSPHHWHRVYTAMRGETLAATVKRLRLNRAAGHLANTQLSIEAIARRSGYPNVQSFTRIFKDVYGMPPAAYRERGSHAQFQSAPDGGSDIMYDVTIRTLPDLRAASVEHIGPYMEVGRAFEQLFGWLGARQLLGPDIRSFAIFYDDVSIMPAAQLHSRAAVVTARTFAVEPPVEWTDIAGGEYAVLRHTGPYSDMKAAYDWLYGTWLPGSGREPGKGPNLEEYLNNPRDTAPADLLTDIYLPLAR